MRAVLTYHSIDTSESPISVSPAAFAGHVRWLANSGIRVMPLRSLVEDARTHSSSEGDAVALTFDDGFANFAEHAEPLLREHALPATVFVVSGHAGTTNAWTGRPHPNIPTLPLLGWDALGRIAESGEDIELGAHTRTHIALDLLSRRLLETEIGGSADDIAAHTGRRPATFAYPFGIAPAVAAEIVRTQFDVGVTTKMRPLSGRENSACVPRLDAYYLRRPDGLDAWGTPKFRAYLTMRAVIRSAREGVR